MMKKLTTATQVFGPYTTVEETGSGWLVDGCSMQRTVVGNATVADWSDGDVAGPINPGPPPRYLIPKSVVQERVYALNKLAALMTILKASGNEIYYARWFAPDWPNVYGDDPAMLQLLGVAGLNSDQIAAVTAPPPEPVVT